MTLSHTFPSTDYQVGHSYWDNEWKHSVRRLSRKLGMDNSGFLVDDYTSLFWLPAEKIGLDAGGHAFSIPC